MLFEPILVEGFAQRDDQRSGRRTHHAQPEAARFEPERKAHVRFADTTGTEQQRVGAVRDAAHRRELFDYFRIDRRLRFPIEALERFDKTGARHLHAHRLMFLQLRGNFRVRHRLQEGAVAQHPEGIS